jgi:hypothetical protein
MFSFNWFGHQSRFRVPPPAVFFRAPLLKGHLASLSLTFKDFCVAGMDCSIFINE